MYAKIKNYVFTALGAAVLVICLPGCTNQKVQPLSLLSEQDPDAMQGMNKPVFLNSVSSSNYLTNIQVLGLFNYAGAINCLVVDRADSNHLLAGANSGGLWVSHNRGVSWQPVNDFANSLKVAALVQHPFRLNEFYYSTGIDIYNSGVLQNDIYKSTDGGVTFSNITPVTLPPFGRVDKIVCSPIDSNTFYFSQFFGPNNTTGGLFRTTDNFNTFQKVLYVSGSLSDFIVLPSGEVQVSSYNNIWKSSSGNYGTYVLSNTGITPDMTQIRLAACTSQPNIRYATVAFGNYNGLCKSIDGGLNWTFIDTLSIGAAPHRITVKPDDPDFILFGLTSLKVSQDGGLTWQYCVGGYDIRSINFDPTQMGKVFVTSDFGISSISVDPVTTTSFTNETMHDSMLVVQEIHSGDYFSTGNRNIIGSQDLGTNLVRTNLPYVFNNGGDGAQCWASKQDSNKAYFSSQAGHMIRSNNLTTNPNGSPIYHPLDTNNDFQIDEGATFWTAFAMNEADDQQLYFPTLKRLWRSLDGGTTWTPVSNYYGNPYYRSYITATKNPDPIVYWSNYDSIFVLANAATAAPLTEFGMPVPGDPLNLMADPFNDSCIYFFKEGTPTKILHSSNLFSDTVQWSDWTANFPAGVTPTCIAFYPSNSQIAFVGSLEGGIYITLDGGATWSRESNFPFVQITDIKIRPSDKKIFVYTYGRGIWSAEFTVPVTVNDNTELSFSIYPNPFTGIIRLQTNEPLHNSEIILTDLQGKMIFKHMADIENYFQINCGFISEGVYLLQIKVNNEIRFSKKVVKI